MGYLDYHLRFSSENHYLDQTIFLKMPVSRVEPSSIKNKIKREEVSRKVKKDKTKKKLEKRLAQAKLESNDPAVKKVSCLTNTSD